MIDIPIGHFKVIHCFLPPGRSHDLLLRLKNEQGIASAFAHHARGGSLSNRKGKESFYYSEMEVVTLLAPAEQADDIFAFVVRSTGIDKPRAGMVVMEKAQMGVAMTLPEGVPDED